MRVRTQVRVYFIVREDGVVQRTAAETADAVRARGRGRRAGDTAFGCERKGKNACS